jgi:hypothetical protein
MMWMGTIAAIASAVSGNKVELPTALIAPPPVARRDETNDDVISVASSLFSSDEDSVLDDSKHGNIKARKRERFVERLDKWRKHKARKKKKRMSMGLSGSSSSGSYYEVKAKDLYCNKNKKSDD